MFLTIPLVGDDSDDNNMAPAGSLFIHVHSNDQGYKEALLAFQAADGCQLGYKVH